MRIDPAGDFWVFAVALVAVCAVVFTSCSSSNSPRSDLANAPDLDVRTASSDSYNCYDNAINKQIVTDPTGYELGDSVEDTFAAVQKDYGKAYIFDRPTDPVYYNEN